MMQKWMTEMCGESPPMRGGGPPGPWREWRNMAATGPHSPHHPKPEAICQLRDDKPTSKMAEKVFNGVQFQPDNQPMHGHMPTGPREWHRWRAMCGEHGVCSSSKQLPCSGKLCPGQWKGGERPDGPPFIPPHMPPPHVLKKLVRRWLRQRALGQGQRHVSHDVQQKDDVGICPVEDNENITASERGQIVTTGKENKNYQSTTDGNSPEMITEDASDEDVTPQAAVSATTCLQDGTEGGPFAMSPGGLPPWMVMQMLGDPGQNSTNPETDSDDSDRECDSATAEKGVSRRTMAFPMAPWAWPHFTGTTPNRGPTEGMEHMSRKRQRTQQHVCRMLNRLRQVTKRDSREDERIQRGTEGSNGQQARSSVDGQQWSAASI